MCKTDLTRPVTKAHYLNVISFELVPSIEMEISAPRTVLVKCSSHKLGGSTGYKWLQTTPHRLAASFGRVFTCRNIWQVLGFLLSLTAMHSFSLSLDDVANPKIFLQIS